MRLRARAKKTIWRWIYDAANHRLTDPGTAFMNYGYAPLEEPYQELGLGPAAEPDRFGIQMYNKVAGAADLAEKDVLEVGCGRGGGATFVFDRFRPRSLTGLDLSGKAIAHCQAVRRRPGLTFVRGDAENLPFADGSFDVVLNVESSHCYADVPRFLAEAHRVLRPDGLLLLADARTTRLPEGRQSGLVREEDSYELRKQVEGSSFDVLDQEDIASGVFCALQLDSDRRRRLIERRMPARLQAQAFDFAGVEGSRMYRLYAAGEVTYLRFVLRKRIAWPSPTT